MIERDDLVKILNDYDKRNLSIGTIGSHSALNIFKGAKEEGFKTVCISKKDSQIVYRKFDLVDEMVLVNDYSDLLKDEVQERLRSLNTILVPHGSFNAYIKIEALMDSLFIPMFGNRTLLRWEVDRNKQRRWLQNSGLTLPRIFIGPSEIDRLAIVKFPGARGGKGYFLVESEESFNKKAREMINKGHITEKDLNNVHIQEYILGVNVYFQYFHSILDKEVELIGMDKRYESTADSIGRIPANEQLKIDLNPTYTIVGNIPLTLRESLLPEVLSMGEKVVGESRKISLPGIIGPFCLETIITDDTKFYTFEISARIVAGTNVGIGTSPYAYLKYGENMYMGRRIASEIKKGIERMELPKIVY